MVYLIYLSGAVTVLEVLEVSVYSTVQYSTVQCVHGSVGGIQISLLSNTRILFFLNREVTSAYMLIQ